jgi:hypothetical protein
MTSRRSVEMVLKSHETTTQSIGAQAGSERGASLRTWSCKVKRPRVRRRWPHHFE